MKKYEAFLADIDKNFEGEEIVVSVIDDLPYLKKGKKYILMNPNNKYRVMVKDIVNNQIISSDRCNFITEVEYEAPEIKKYNL